MAFGGRRLQGLRPHPHSPTPEQRPNQCSQKRSCMLCCTASSSSAQPRRPRPSLLDDAMSSTSADPLVPHQAQAIPSPALSDLPGCSSKPHLPTADCPAGPSRRPSLRSLNESRLLYRLAWSASAVAQIVIAVLPLDFRILYLIAHISLIASRSEVCWDKFDMNYRNQCLNGESFSWSCIRVRKLMFLFTLSKH